ncbi:MAG: molybdopterin-dependent oxidoreductase [Pseudomonadota bacterium]
MDGGPLPRIRSTCPYCGVGCGVILSPDKAGGVVVSGDPDHPANKGRLCSKGMALGETTDLTDRLLQPLVDGVSSDCDIALTHVAQRFTQTIAEHGPDSVAFYVSGQLLTEDYYVANKLIKGFIGSANIDTNSRLCMASTVAGHKRAFGTDTVPGLYTDLEEADLVILVGSNLAWCHPVLYQRLAAARSDRGTTVVVIDPRRTATCDIADLHLRLRPGSDVALFNGLLAHLNAQGSIDPSFVADHVDGLAEALAQATEDDLSQTGLAAADLEAFFTLFTATEKTVTVFSQGVNQSAQGTDKVNAIINCHLATGRIGKPGMGPLSVTGQPNAMGGREVGGLANMLAAHLDLENPAHRAAVGDFWATDAIPGAPGLKAVDMFDAVADGRIQALWIACTNPAVSLPNADAVAAAISGCDFTVVSDLSDQTDTARLADVVLPAQGWGEKDGTVTNSDRMISRQRRALPAPGHARADWAIFAEVGRRMGWQRAFDYQSAAEVFREHAALSHLAGGFGRDFDISALADISDAAYDALEPVHWPVSAQRAGGRFFGDGAFFTPNGRARMIPVRQVTAPAKTAPRYPFRLNTGRIRDQWHTMTRTAKTARLSRHLAEPFLQIHPSDAATLGLKPADLARVTSPTGTAILRVLISPDATPGAPFAPIHWTEQTAPAAKIGPVVQAATDPISGQPDSKATMVAITREIPAWYGFAVSQTRIDARGCTYWAQVKADGGWRCELAGAAAPADWDSFATDLFGLGSPAESFVDAAQNTRRIAFHTDGRLQAALFVSPEPVSVARDYVAAALGQPVTGLLAARPAGDLPDPGPTVCSCMTVGRNTLLTAIAEGATDLPTLCDRTGAGTSCGSCRPEIADLIARTTLRQAAE